MKKIPVWVWASRGSNNTTARALGERGLESARHLFKFEPDRLRNLYRIAHSERR